MNKIKAGWKDAKQRAYSLIPGYGNNHVPNPPNGMVFSEKAVVIIGAAGALGRETARKFVEYGAGSILLTGDNEDSLQSLSRELTDYVASDDNLTCAVTVKRLDLSDPNAVREFIDFCHTSKEHPWIDVLLFNAASFERDFYSREVIQNNRTISTERMMQVNCYSQCLIFMALLPLLLLSAEHRTNHSLVTFVTCSGMCNGYGRILPGAPDALRDHLGNRDTWDSTHQFYLTKLFITLFVSYYAQIQPINDTPGVIVNMACPGILRHSNLYQHFSLARRLSHKAHTLSCRHEKMAARVLLAAANSDRGTHGYCLRDTSTLRGSELVVQYAQASSARLVYRLICGVLRNERTDLVLPDDPDPNNPQILVHPWDTGEISL